MSTLVLFDSGVWVRTGQAVPVWASEREADQTTNAPVQGATLITDAYIDTDYEDCYFARSILRFDVTGLATPVSATLYVYASILPSASKGVGVSNASCNNGTFANDTNGANYNKVYLGFAAGKHDVIAKPGGASWITLALNMAKWSPRSDSVLDKTFIELALTDQNDYNNVETNGTYGSTINQYTFTATGGNAPYIDYTPAASGSVSRRSLRGIGR